MQAESTRTGHGVARMNRLWARECPVGEKTAMYFCSDCQLPVSLDDAVTIFRDGTCICLACHHRADARPAMPATLRRAVEALLSELDAV